MTSLESISHALAHLDKRLRTIPDSSGPYAADAFLIAAGVAEEAAVALDQAAEQPPQHREACQTLLHSLARQFRARANQAQALAPVFAPPAEEKDADWDRGMLPRESPR